MRCDCYNLCTHRRPYGFARLLLDCVLLLATGGLWLIWILFRELRRS